jgi:ParB-like chromosome segregation protein Spo0J
MRLRSGLAEREAHPVAALFPMLEGDDLTALAEDIAQRGQLHPIVLDDEGRILDGRNRYAACLLAGVEPEFTDYDGDDPDGYALAVNAQRRDLTSGKRAVIAVRVLQLARFGDQVALARALRVDQARVSEAVAVYRWAPALADAIIDSSTTLSAAVEVAREEKRKAEQNQAKLDRLRDSAPDLFARVDDGQISADEATSLLDARLTKERQKEHEQSIARAQAIEAGKGAAKVIVSRFRSDAAAVVGASRLGERLVTKAMVNEIQEALGLLEEEL